MNLGFFTMPIHPLGKDWKLSLREDREDFLLGDRTRFFRSLCRRTRHRSGREHHLLHRVSRLDRSRHQADQARDPARSTSPNTHPATVAATMAMLDHMLDGRLIFGISPGGLLSDAELFGNLEADRNAMFLESINQVLESGPASRRIIFRGNTGTSPRRRR